ncbi:MAG: DEAD/DEAH box helicase [Lachnospiraceae bacterium]
MDKKEETVVTFNDYDLKPETQNALELLGYLEPTPIQRQALPIILDGKDMVGKAETGSGKTAAFGIPICDKILWEENAPQALILEPTRELALQVKEELFRIGRKRRIKVPAVFGGMPIEKEILALKQKSHIVVGTPGRLNDHIKRDTLALSHIDYLVIDEADLMLDMGFFDEMETIIETILKNRKPQIMMFSATMGPHLTSLIERYMSKPVEISIQEKNETGKNVTQLSYLVDSELKFQSFYQVLVAENPEECMIFCETRDMVNTLYHKLKRLKLRCVMLHGGMEQRERLYAVNDFRKGKYRCLVTTDVAARGIDFEHITHVINYDFPFKKTNYVHRIGRTARNGKTGTAISFFTPDQEELKKRVEEYIGMKIPVCSLPVLNPEKERLFLKKQQEKMEVREGKDAVFTKNILKLTVGGGKKSKIRPGDLVGTICTFQGITADDIGIIEILKTLSYVEILNDKGKFVFEELQKIPIKGKLRKIEIARK